MRSGEKKRKENTKMKFITLHFQDMYFIYGAHVRYAINLIHVCNLSMLQVLYVYIYAPVYAIHVCNPPNTLGKRQKAKHAGIQVHRHTHLLHTHVCSNMNSSQPPSTQTTSKDIHVKRKEPEQASIQSFKSVLLLATTLTNYLHNYLSRDPSLPFPLSPTGKRTIHAHAPPP